VTCLLLPLSFLDSCSQLKFTSALGLGGVAYYMAAIVVRYAQGGYAPGGFFHGLIAPEMRPSFDVSGGSIWSPRALVLVSMLTAAYICHSNAPKFYRELEGRSIPRFALRSAIGFGLAALTYVLGLCCTFLTFGGASSGFIFNNYASVDGLFVIARVITSFVILCTYPLMMVALRDGALDLLSPGTESSPRVRRSVTLGLVALLTALGLVVKDVGLIVSVPGAIFGSAVVYIFPGLVFLRATRPTLDGKIAASSAALLPRMRAERWACRALVVTGLLCGTLGAASALGFLK